MLVVRPIVYLLLALQVAGIALSGWIYLQSANPEPGSQMVLMAIPLISPPLIIIAALTVWMANRESLNFKAGERRLVDVLAVFSVIPIGIMLVVGVVDQIWFLLSTQVL